jgi:hypothetical protein
MLLSSVMPYLLIAYETRKPELTTTEFADYYDNIHVPLIKKMTGPLFPLSHARHYLQRQSGPPEYLPAIFFGELSDFDYDAVVIMTFESEEAMMNFQKRYMEPEVLKTLQDSESKFIISSKLRVVGAMAPHVTTRDD